MLGLRFGYCEGGESEDFVSEEKRDLQLCIHEHVEARLATRDGEIAVFDSPLREGKFSRVDPAGASVESKILAGLLAVFGSTIEDMKGMKMFCRGPADPVVFVLDGKPRAALKPERWC